MRTPESKREPSRIRRKRRAKNQGKRLRRKTKTAGRPPKKGKTG